ncbi:MAG TPA: alpha/beta hydrolase domain-containing protein [Vicinamibacterales bacterium]|nr:alpha/beta hydrolase domain-containing protein [Vicinamibacterales bacterium]
MKITTFALTACLVAVSSYAEVIRVETAPPQDIAEYGYQQVTGKAYFVIDPKDPRNAVVADIDKAPRNAEGKIEFTADLLALWPKVGDGNNVALVDVVNRGSTTAFRLNRTAGQNLVGDGFLLKQGFTIICIGWEFDVAARNGAIRIQAPVATDSGAPITGTVRAAFIPDRRDVTYTMTDVAAYPPADVNDPTATLKVRDGLSAAAQTIPRSQWTISGNVITMQAGFEPGRNYEVSYKAANPPVSGLGLIAVRDITAFAKHEAQKHVKYAVGFGVSQSGRFLRTFLYDGMNTDEKGRQVFDGVMAHIAGAARLDVNRRWATPTGLGTYAATAFPFADMAQKDPVSGTTDGLLDNPRARMNQPKIFYTNTGVEYWGGGRSAALIHTTADGTKDIALPSNVRTYFFAGNQHGPSAFPPPEGQGQQKANPTDYWWSMRALVIAMQKWVTDGTLPPPSQYPKLSDGTLVRMSAVSFPAIPGVQSPKTLTAGVRMSTELAPGSAGAGAPLPFLVPQVDADGNERAGIRLPEVSVPLATYTGWNFRNSRIGGTGQLVSLLGSYIPFASTKADRTAKRDPRPSIEERYASRDKYMDAINKAAAGLVKDGYLLPADVPAIAKRAADHWEFARETKN